MFVPPVLVHKAKLRDGELVTLRTISPEDAPRLQALFSSLSPTSRFFRFLSCMKEMPDEWAKKLADVDSPAEMALIATREDGDQERLIADARYAIEPFAEMPSAEFAIAIQDDFQHRGLGKILLKQLAALASAHGIRTFTALVHSENHQMLQLLGHSGFTLRTIEKGRGEVRLAVEIMEADSGVDDAFHLEQGAMINKRTSRADEEGGIYSCSRIFF